VSLLNTVRIRAAIETNFSTLGGLRDIAEFYNSIDANFSDETMQDARIQHESRNSSSKKRKSLLCNLPSRKKRRKEEQNSACFEK